MTWQVLNMRSSSPFGVEGVIARRNQQAISLNSFPSSQMTKTLNHMISVAAYFDHHSKLWGQRGQVVRTLDL